MADNIRHDDHIEHVGFAQISHLLTLSGISDGAYRTYALLKALAQQKSNVWWGVNRLAILRGIGMTRLKSHLAELIEAHLIRRERRLGTSSMTYLVSLNQAFPELASQCVSAALWGSIEADDDLLEVVTTVRNMLHPTGVANQSGSRLITSQVPDRKEEEVKENKLLCPQRVQTLVANKGGNSDQALSNLTASEKEGVSTEQSLDTRESSQQSKRVSAPSLSDEQRVYFATDEGRASAAERLVALGFESGVAGQALEKYGVVRAAQCLMALSHCQEQVLAGKRKHIHNPGGLVHCWMRGEMGGWPWRAQ